MKKISLVSREYKVLGLVMTPLASVFAFCVIFLLDNKNAFTIIFGVILLIFFWYALFISFYSKIIVKNNMITFRVFHWLIPKLYIFNLNEIVSIELDSNPNDINVFRVETINNKISFTGFNSLKGYKGNLRRSKEVVNEINEYLKY